MADYKVDRRVSCVRELRPAALFYESHVIAAQLTADEEYVSASCEEARSRGYRHGDLDIMKRRINREVAIRITRPCNKETMRNERAV